MARTNILERRQVKVITGKVTVLLFPISDPGFGEFHFMESLNHLNVCKPANKMSPLYQLTLEFIRHCIPLNLVENILRANIPEEYILPEDFEM